MKRNTPGRSVGRFKLVGAELLTLTLGDPGLQLQRNLYYHAKRAETNVGPMSCRDSVPFCFPSWQQLKGMLCLEKLYECSVLSIQQSILF